MKTILLIFATAIFAVAAAADNYKLTLFHPSQVGDKELKAGVYKMRVDENHVIIQQGRSKKFEADVEVETGDETYSNTTVRYSNGDGKYTVSEILLEGTSKKLVFN